MSGSTNCAVCDVAIIQPKIGRPRLYCGDACGWRAWKNANPGYSKAYYRRNPEGRRAIAARHRVGARTLVTEAKAGGCVDCDETDPVVLDFDHVRGEKLFTIGERKDGSRARLLAEIAKCEVRCANCHRRRTDERRNSA